METTMNTSRQRTFIDPKIFTLWIAMVSMAMIFAGLTSAYIVRKGDGLWLDITLPSFFAISTGVIAVSSVTVQFAHHFAKKNNIKLVQLLLGISSILGILFVYCQFKGYGQLIDNNYFLVGNPASSFIYVISGTHGVHLIGGLIFLIVTFISAMRYKIHSKAMRQITMCTTFWHFLGFLWIYLYFFFQMNN